MRTEDPIPAPFEVGLPLWDIKTLSKQLAIKTSTLYAWVEQGKIPAVRVNRLIRFRPEEIAAWLAGCPTPPSKGQEARSKKRKRGGAGAPEVTRLVARARREAYNDTCGKTRPTSAHRKGETDGAV